MGGMVDLTFLMFSAEDPLLLSFLLTELLVPDDDVQLIEEIGLVHEGLLIDMKERFFLNMGKGTL